MKLFRYRKPSINNVLGITRAKRHGKKALGVNAVMAPLRVPGNFVRGVKRKSGYYAVNRILKGRVPTPLGIGGSSVAGIAGCLPLLFLVWVIGSIGSCGRAPEATRAAQPSVPMKNGRPLTPEQIRERDAYIARAAAKKRGRQQDELKRAQAQLFAAQLQSQAFQGRQAAKNQSFPASTRTNPVASNAQFDAGPDQSASTQEQRPAIVPGWDGSAPTREVRSSVETFHTGANVEAADPGVYAPPVAYQNLPPGTTGTRVFQPEYGSNSARSRSYGNFSGASSYASSSLCGATTKKRGSCRRAVRGGGYCYQHR